MKKTFHFLLFLCLLVLCACGGKAGSTDYAEGIHEIPDLAGKKVSVLLGAIDEKLLSDVRPEATMLRMNTVPEVIAAAESGQADYMLVDTCCVIGAGLPERGMKVVFSSQLVRGDYAFAFRYDEQPLCDELNAFLARYRADGRWEALKNRWTQGAVNEVVMEHPDLNPDGPVLRVGTISSFPFTFMQNGRNAGFEPELLEEFCAETGRNIEYLTIDFSGLIAALVSGKIDMISAGMFKTEERAKQVLFSDGYFNCGSVCLCRDTQATLARKPFLVRIQESFYNNLILEDRWKIIVNGLWETLIISLCSILLGSLLGGLICMMRMSRRRAVSGIAKAYVEIMRGVPILVLLMLMFYVIFSTTSLAPRWVAVIAFAMNFGAYVSEMYRTGIESIDKGQTEAGLAMGFTPFQTYAHFVLPQAAKRVIPVFKGEAVSLFKNTSVVGFIAIQDLTKASDIIRARTFDAFFPLIIISIIYFVLAWLFGKALDRLAKRL